MDIRCLGSHLRKRRIEDIEDYKNNTFSFIICVKITKRVRMREIEREWGRISEKRRMRVNEKD